ncbi:MAG: excinuclease ABC subunit UvrB, partial [Bacteroidales bacterium]|nr:excinuclease ABC subunit UvrB [Bacteroidales bacterium]
YYDYYQPEAYLPITDTYIEKDLTINKEIEKLRLSTTSALLSGRKDVIVVSSVSCLYGIGNPEDFYANTIRIKTGEKISRNVFLRQLVASLYSRNQIDFQRGTFRVQGDTVDIFVAYGDYAYRIMFFGDEIEEIESFDPINNFSMESLEDITIFPANIFMTTKERLNAAIHEIQDDLVKHVAFLKETGKHLEAKRIDDRVNNDLEMMRELGHCPGVENYSRYFDGRKPGTRPFCLLDYFPKDYLTIIDESHVTLPQIRAMYGGDHARKQNLIEYGFRLPAAIDNRPLKFEEFEGISHQTIYLSATPADYELDKCGGVIVEQLIRPTGLLDPPIEVRPTLNQIDDLLNEVQKRILINERILITTLTKKMAEELSKYLLNIDVKNRYIHSDVDTMERVEIMDQLRQGIIDVIVGVNLLREGLDLPEVSLVAILDADKEGFLRSERSLTQTAGRAARNINGLVIMYAEVITKSMQKTIDETNRRRSKQMTYNIENNITPTQIKKAISSVMGNQTMMQKNKYDAEQAEINFAAEPVVAYMNKDGLEKAIQKAEKDMKKAARELDFLLAAQFRDEMQRLNKILQTKFGNN